MFLNIIDNLKSISLYPDNTFKKMMVNHSTIYLYKLERIASHWFLDERHAPLVATITTLPSPTARGIYLSHGLLQAHSRTGTYRYTMCRSIAGRVAWEADASHQYTLHAILPHRGWPEHVPTCLHSLLWVSDNSDRHFGTIRWWTRLDNVHAHPTIRTQINAQMDNRRLS